MAESNETTSIDPKNILDLIPGNAIKHMLTGFSHQLQAGVALLYPVRQPSARDELRPIQASKELFHKVCRAYRNTPGCDQNCEQQDHQIAWDYITGRKTDAGIYKCHLKLHDMAYPLRTGDRVWGVVFAGQAILDDKDDEEEITTAILSSMSTEYSGKVLENLTNCKKLQPKDLKDRFADFCEFGKMMQLLVDTAYEKFLDAGFRAFCARTSLTLTVSSTKENIWWGAVATSSRQFCGYTGIESVRFFSRWRSRYELMATNEGFWHDERILVPTKLLAVLPEDKLSSLPRNIADRLGLPTNKPAYVFKKDLIEERKLGISTAIILTGIIRQDIRESVTEYCRMVCLRAGVTDLVRRIDLGAQDTRDRVRDASHSTKTPLQWIVDLQDNDGAFLPNVLATTRSNVKKHALLVKAYLRYLHAVSDSPRQSLDFSLLTCEAVTDCMPTAQAKPVRIEWMFSPTRTIVYADPLGLRAVLDNLLSNAIKYSWHTTHNAIRSIRLEMNHEEGYARLRIQNYGIGIDTDTLNHLNEDDEPYGFRSKIEDPSAIRRGEDRPGTGSGIAICKRILESHGGWLWIDSEPAKSESRAETETYHRYLTTVTVHLPLNER